MSFLDDLTSGIGDVASTIGQTLGGIVQGLPALAGVAVKAAPQIMQFERQQQMQKFQERALKTAFTRMPTLGLGVQARPILPSSLGYGSAPAGGIMVPLLGGPNTGVYGGAMNFGSGAMGTGAEVGGGIGGVLGEIFGGPAGALGGAGLGAGLGAGIGGLGGLMFGGSGLPANFGKNVMTATNARGQTVLVRSLGRPILWSGDLAAARRVQRVARKIGRFVHHRRF